jgi:hypothetical protein
MSGGANRACEQCQIDCHGVKAVASPWIVTQEWWCARGILSMRPKLENLQQAVYTTEYAAVLRLETSKRSHWRFSRRQLGKRPSL